jgi:hypothetical protein
LIASVSVGIVVAFFLFPMIELVKRSTRSYVTDSWESEITRRVGQYEQIHANQGNTPQMEDVLPYNLALSRWQELHSEKFMLHHSRAYAVSFAEAADFVADKIAGKKSGTGSTFWEPFYSDKIDERQLWSEPQSINWIPDNMADSMLLVTPGRNNSIRSAFGQNILLRDGRVFLRVLPGMETEK